MVASGAFTKRDRLELIEGNLVEKMTQNPPHSVTVGSCDDTIRSCCRPAGTPARRSPSASPSVTACPAGHFGDARQACGLAPPPSGPADVALVVEVADSSVEDDRAMAVTYGGGNVPVYWPVNIRDRQIEVYTGPSGPSEPVGYRHCEVLFPGDVVTLMLEGREVARIPVADLLPQANERPTRSITPLPGAATRLPVPRKGCKAMGRRRACEPNWGLS